MRSGKNPQELFADDMLAFVSAIPQSCHLEWVKERDFLFYFEAERILSIIDLLKASGVDPKRKMKVLDFGYLHGLIPEFLHRSFPNLEFTVCDHPQSPVFTNEDYLKIIAQRTYLKLRPLDLRDIGQLQDHFDLIVLGEIIEHLDPTVACRFFSDLKPLLAPGGAVLVTTPNDSGLYNCMMRLRQRSPVHLPFPDQTMQYPHIHLWSLDILTATMARLGLQLVGVRFNDGFEGWSFAKLGREWGSLFYQVSMRAIWILTRYKSSWRGFFVALYR